ncbi:MAG TPA: YihY/virulence factor BrkB family protein [Burkholderiales bacterium]
MSLGRDLYEVWTLGGQSPRRLARRVWDALTAGNLLGYAAQLAYYFLFALFPFFVFLAALLAYVPVPNLMDEIMSVVQEFLAEEAAAMIRQNVTDLITKPRGGLLSFSILFALFLASSAVAAIGEALNHAYGVRESRPLWRVRGTAMVLTVVLAGLAIASTALLIFGPEVGGWLAGRLGVGEQFRAVWPFIRWPIVVFLLMLNAALIYYFTPDVEQEWRWITPGSVLAILAWIAVSLGFRYYVDNFGKYNATYGSIGAIIVLLTWLYLSGLMLLVGGEINAEIEHAAKGGKDRGEKRLPRASRGPKVRARWQLGLRRK